ncbi:MAG: GDP-mannose 4,6-dehydratase [Parafilimonas sp.]
MKILITGFAGFASRHFLNLLSKKEEGCEILGLDRNDITFDIKRYKNINCKTIQTDIKDKVALLKVLQNFSPDYILHLASASSVHYSWQHPSEVFLNNNSIFLALLDAAKEYEKAVRILSTGTSDVYGVSATEKEPLKETTAIHPANPYAVSKASQEMIAKIYVDNFSLDIIQTRSFTHFGAYQKDNFVLAKFAKELQLIKKDKQPPVLTTGNIDVIRDLTDVRDIVNAYYLLLKNGKTGEIYNVCSGKGRSLRNALEEMQNQLSMHVDLKLDETLLRKGEIQSIVGNNEMIKADTGWQPEITFEKSIADLLDYWDRQF